jgi:hypothetical protein
VTTAEQAAPGGGSLPEGRPIERLASAVRALLELMVAAPVDDAAATEAATTLEAVAGELGRRAGPGRRPRGQLDPTDDPQAFFPTSPVTGLENPLAPPVRIWTEPADGGGNPVVRGEVTFGAAYEGPPTCVHGGVLAALFDEVLGAANLAAGHPGMTGTLTVRYRRPTPLGVPLAVEAVCRGRQGRKIHGWAGVYHGDVLTAEADGLFVEVRPDAFLAIAERHAHAVGPDAVAALRAVVGGARPPGRAGD